MSDRLKIKPQLRFSRGHGVGVGVWLNIRLFTADGSKEQADFAE